MLKTCKYCGIVDYKHVCPHAKRRYIRHDVVTDAFRHTQEWTNKSIEIRERDNYICAVCFANKYDTIKRINYEDISVHHIIPIDEDYDKRLDNDNLITLCSRHHYMADHDKIPKSELLQMVKDKQSPRGSDD